MKQASVDKWASWGRRLGWAFFIITPIVWALSWCGKIETGGGDFAKGSLTKIAKEPLNENIPGVPVEGGLGFENPDAVDDSNVMRTQAQTTTDLMFIIKPELLGKTGTLRIRNKTLDVTLMEIPVTPANGAGYVLDAGDAGALKYTIYPGDDAMSASFVGGKNEMFFLAHDLDGARSVSTDAVVEDFAMMSPAILSSGNSTSMSADGKIQAEGSVLSRSAFGLKAATGGAALDHSNLSIFYEPNASK